MKVLLLTSNSRESQNKAHQLGLACLRQGWKHTIASEWKPGHDLEIPCSDSKIGQTVWAKRADWAGSKLKTAAKLRSLGLPYLPTVELKSYKDLEECHIEGPVFIKSDRSSGVVSPHAFGYKRFESVEALKLELNRRWPGALDNDAYKEVFGPYVLQPFVPVEGMLTVSFVGSTMVAPSFVKTDSDSFYNWMHFSSKYSGLEGFQVLADEANLPFLYIQCLDVEGVPTPIDVNVRLSTYLDTLMSELDPAFYDWCLDQLSGARRSFDVPESVIGRIKTDYTKPCWSRASTAKAKLLFFGLQPSASGKFDSAYSHPTYIIEGNNALDELPSFLATVEVHQ